MRPIRNFSLFLFTALCLFLWLAGNLLAQDGSFSDTLRFQGVISSVLQRNNRAAAARFMEKAAYGEIGPAGAWDDPMLMLGVQNLPTSFDFNDDEMTMKMVGLSQKIPYAGDKGFQGKAARSRADAVREDTRGTILEIVTAAKFAYLNLYYRRQAYQFVMSQRDLQNDVLKSVTDRLKTNQSTQADISAAQADLWRTEADILTSEQEVIAAENELLALMGQDPGTKIPPLASPDFATADQPLINWLGQIDNYPVLRKSKFQSDSYRYSASAARRMRWPMLELEGSYGFRSDPEPDPESHLPPMPVDDMVSFQMNLSVPIFSGRQQGSMARSMEAMRQSSEAEYNQLRRDIEADLTSLHSRIQRLSRSLILYRDRIIPADLDAFRSAIASFSINRLPFASLQMYAFNIYSDRLMANQVEYDLARSLAEAEKYLTDPNILGPSEFR
jgi:outer membrane protein TolC